eukprot:gene10418-12321_t
MLLLHCGLIFLTCLVFSTVVPSLALPPGKKVRVPKDLRDVVDNEEDEAWKEFGRDAGTFDPTKPDPDPIDWSQPTVDVAKLLKKQQRGPQLAFARLKPDDTGKRTKEDVDKVGFRWASLLGSGGMTGNKMYAIDSDTILINLDDGTDIEEVKRFVLLQVEADEFEWNKKIYRRDGDSAPARPSAKESKGTKRMKKKKKKKKKKSDVELG